MRHAYLTTAALLAMAVAITPARAAPSQRYEPEAASSHLAVQGTSTMHDWEAVGDVIRGHLILSETDLASLWARGISSLEKIAPTVRVEIPVESLESGKSGLDKKMHETLKARTHPVIAYRLEAAELKPGRNASETDTEEQLAVDTKGVLTVAGESRAVEIPMQIRRLPNSRLEISGQTTLRMTDFGIDPPKLMMGLLRTGDEVRVRWKCVLIPTANASPNEQ